VTPAQLATIHAAAFPDSRPWSADEFTALLAQPPVFLTQSQAGFAVGRVIAGEAELITLAVAPKARRRGVGRGLLRAFETLAQAHGAARGLLEVAEDNHAARALYHAAGWRESARRVAYYQRPNGERCDALLLEIYFT